jgi:hypothetical protein
MKKYITIIRAIDPKTNELCNWMNPNVPGISFATAQSYCNNSGLRYCEVIGKLKMDIPIKKDGSPD